MRYPFYKQQDKADCGVACLRMICKYHGRYLSADRLRRLASQNRDGTTMHGLKQAAKSLGLKAEGVRLGWHEMQSYMDMPCIILWQKYHFVVVYRIEKNWTRRKTIVRIADPAHGLLSLTEEEFLNGWLTSNNEHEGYALLVEPTAAFYNIKGSEKESKLTFRSLNRYFAPHRSTIIKIVIAMLLGSGISLVFPFLTQAVVDKGINGKSLHLILLLLIGQLLLSCGQTVNNFIRAWLMLHMTTSVNIAFISDFLHKLTRLPISFFDVRRVGDIMQRISDNARIQSFLTSSLLSIAIATVTFLVYAVIMAGYNLYLLVFFLLGSCFYILWTLLFLKRRKKLDFLRFQKQSENQSGMIQMITGMQEIKINGNEMQRLEEWKEIQRGIYDVSIKSMVLGQVQSLGGTFIDQIKNIIISYWAARMVIEGNMTLGMMMAMQYVLGQLNAPVSQFIGFIQSAQDATISLERMGEIYNMEDEEPEDENTIKEIPASANIEFKNVYFRYDRSSSTDVLSDMSFTIEKGKVTAIVGESGSGKSTILKLLLGFYPPQKGKILLDGKPIEQYSCRNWRNACGTVMQDGFIFSDTIKRNICMRAGDIDEKQLNYALEMSNLQQYVDNLPLRLDTKIGMEGNGMSSGQRQRILIARAVYKNPCYIFLDEATNSLDSNNESYIQMQMNQFYQGRTVLVIAHRLSTIRHADKIIVIKNGHIVEEGKHEQLLQNHGLYYDLINKQL